MSEERRTGWEDADRWFSDEAPRGGEGGGGGGRGDGGEHEGPPPVPRCEVCGAELEPDQTYCLECGSPTPLAPRLRRGGKAAAMIAGAMVVLGVGAGALAYAVANDDDDEAGATATSTAAVTALPTGTATVVAPPLTGPLPPDTSVTTPTAPSTTPTAPPATGFETVTGVTPTTPPATGTTTAATEPEPEPDPEPVPDSGSSDWPAGETAWTAVLSSVRDESDARAAKSRLSGSGEPAGVLFSSDYSGLRPGYWVVFSGMFDDRGQAVSQASDLRSGFPGAYARRIEG